MSVTIGCRGWECPKEDTRATLTWLAQQGVPACWGAPVVPTGACGALMGCRGWCVVQRKVLGNAQRGPVGVDNAGVGLETLRQTAFCAAGGCRAAGV
jgi:hypothetical protein